MNVYLNLTFGTTGGKLYTMRIPNAQDSTVASPVRNAMNKLIDAGCIKTKYGDLSSRESAKLVRTTTTPCEMD